jgi:hypothetical protein
LVFEVVRGDFSVTAVTAGEGFSPEERNEIDVELDRAAAAIAAGNDGKARVCARRASGVALRSWHRARGNRAAPPDAQSLLKLASVDPGLPLPVREAATRLSAQSAGPAASGGGSSIDPIADARIIIAAVLPPATPPADV